MIRKIWYLISLCLLLGMWGCDSKSDPTPDPWAEAEDLDVNLCLQVSVSDAAGTGASTTRVVRNDTIFHGTDTLPTQKPAWVYENINTLRVIIVRPDSTVEYNVMESLPALESVEHFKELMFKVSTSQGLQDSSNPNIRIERKRIYLIANEASIQPKELRDTLAKLYPGSKIAPSDTKNGKGTGAPKWLMYNGDWNQGKAIPMIDNEHPTDGKGQFVPMSEFFDVDVKFDISKGASHRVQAEKMFITRNLVKFQFTLRGPESDKLRITKITFSNLMRKEYLFPYETVYYPPKADREADVRYIESFTTPGRQDNTLRAYDFEPDNFVWDGEEYKKADKKTIPAYDPQIYFCETMNYIASGESTMEKYQISVEAEVTGLDGKSQRVTFENKTLPNLPAFPRNTIVEINLIFSDRDLNFEVALVPYIGCYLDPWFGLEETNNN